MYYVQFSICFFVDTANHHPQKIDHHIIMKRHLKLFFNNSKESKYVTPSSTNRAGPFTRKYDHDAKPDVKQSQRVRDKPTHRAHPSHGAEHATAAIRTPHDCSAANHVPARAIHGRHDAHQADYDQRQQAIPQHRGAPREGQAAGKRALIMPVRRVHSGSGSGGG